MTKGGEVSLGEGVVDTHDQHNIVEGVLPRTVNFDDHPVEDVVVFVLVFVDFFLVLQVAIQLLVQLTLFFDHVAVVLTQVKLGSWRRWIVNVYLFLLWEHLNSI